MKDIPVKDVEEEIGFEMFESKVIDFHKKYKS